MIPTQHTDGVFSFLFTLFMYMISLRLLVYVCSSVTTPPEDTLYMLIPIINGKNMTKTITFDRGQHIHRNTSLQSFVLSFTPGYQACSKHLHNSMTEPNHRPNINFCCVTQDVHRIALLSKRDYTHRFYPVPVACTERARGAQASTIPAHSSTNIGHSIRTSPFLIKILCMRDEILRLWGIAQSAMRLRVSALLCDSIISAERGGHRKPCRSADSALVGSISRWSKDRVVQPLGSLARP